MGNSLHLENAFIDELAKRINSARQLYGQDSAYVIGMVTAIDWIAEAAEGGGDVRQALHARIGDGEVKMPTPVATPPSREDGEVQEANKESLAENTWIKGEVKWFNNDKGYGFISTDSQIDVFVHWRDISSWDRSLVQGDEVEFMVTRTAKGFQAINVMKAGSEEATEGGGEERGEEATEASDRRDDGEQCEAVVEGGGGDEATIQDDNVQLPGSDEKSVY